jgi:Tol biopolymer transport system component
VTLGGDQLGWTNVSTLTPLSPDGRWIAYAGSQSDAIGVDRDGHPDRGRTVHIVRVK